LKKQIIRDIPEEISQKRNSDIQKKEKNFLSVKKIVTLKRMDMTAINTEIKILKIKIVYRRKVVILQNLRKKNAGEKPKFYIIIEKNILSVSRKRTQSSSTENFFFQRFKANPSFIYEGINLKNYNNHIEKCSLYFKDHARTFFTEFEKITYTAIFTESIPRNK
jgi:hypothetical protein